EALPFLEAAARADARSLYLYHLGRGQLALDRPAEAVVASRRALERGRAEGASASDLEKIHYQLGLALRKTGAAEEAAAELAEARRLSAAGASAGRDAADLDPSVVSAFPPSVRRELRARVVAGSARAYFNLGVLETRRASAAPATE